MRRQELCKARLCSHAEEGRGQKKYQVNIFLDHPTQRWRRRIERLEDRRCLDVHGNRPGRTAKHNDGRLLDDRVGTSLGSEVGNMVRGSVNGPLEASSGYWKQSGLNWKCSKELSRS